MVFDWDDANILHLARHDITPDEAEQVLKNDPVDIEEQYINEEFRLLQAGETNTGRILTILSTLRYVRIRVISGWPAQGKEAKIYLSHKVNQLWKLN